MGLFKRKELPRVQVFRDIDALIAHAVGLLELSPFEIERQLAAMRITAEGRASLDSAAQGMTDTRNFLLTQVAILDAALARYGVPVEAPPEDDKPLVMA